MVTDSQPEPIGNSRLLLLAAVALIALVLGVSLPSWPKIYGVVNNFAHAPVFGMFALVVLRLIRTRRSSATARAGDYGIAFAVAIGAGGLVEFAQIFTDRDASLEDLGTDALGAGCALGIAAAFDRQLWPEKIRLSGGRVAAAAVGLFCGLWALLPVGQAVIAYVDRATAFPAVVRFSSPRDLYFIGSGTARLSLQPLPARWARPGDDLSLRIDFTARVWPGMSHDEPEPDWRGFSALVLDVTNPDETPLRLTVRVHDAAHDQRHADRFNRAFEVLPANRMVLRILMPDILAGPVGRPLDLAHVAGIVVFESSGAASVGRYFYLTRIWLE
jgi:hypothetical protein